MVAAANFGIARHIYLKNLYIHHIKGIVGQSIQAKDTGGIGIFIEADDTTDTRFDDILIEGCRIQTIDNTGIFTRSRAGGSNTPGQANWNRRRITNLRVRRNKINDIAKNAMIIRMADGRHRPLQHQPKRQGYYLLHQLRQHQLLHLQQRRICPAWPVAANHRRTQERRQDLLLLQQHNLQPEPDSGGLDYWRNVVGDLAGLIDRGAHEYKSPGTGPTQSDTDLEGTRTVNLRIDSHEDPNDKHCANNELTLPEETVYKDVRRGDLEQDNTIPIANDLAGIIESWARLPEHVRQAINDDSDVLVYRFSKDFPEIRKHAEAYEAEIAKLIANLDIDTETVLVEYRDI